MISKGPYTYDPQFSQIRDVNGWSIANVPNPAGLGDANDADNGRLLAGAWELARALTLALTWLDNLAATMGEETLLNSLPNNTGGRVQMRAALEAAGWPVPSAPARPAKAARLEAERAVNAAALASMGEPEELEE